MHLFNKNIIEQRLEVCEAGYVIIFVGVGTVGIKSGPILFVDFRSCGVGHQQHADQHLFLGKKGDNQINPYYKQKSVDIDEPPLPPPPSTKSRIILSKPYVFPVTG